MCVNWSLFRLHFWCVTSLGYDLFSLLFHSLKQSGLPPPTVSHISKMCMGKCLKKKKSPKDFQYGRLGCWHPRWPSMMALGDLGPEGKSKMINVSVVSFRNFLGRCLADTIPGHLRCQKHPRKLCWQYKRNSDTKDKMQNRFPDWTKWDWLR